MVAALGPVGQLWALLVAAGAEPGCQALAGTAQPQRRGQQAQTMAQPATPQASLFKAEALAAAA
jgi:hypothetical protein